MAVVLCLFEPTRSKLKLVRRLFYRQIVQRQPAKFENGRRASPHRVLNAVADFVRSHVFSFHPLPKKGTVRNLFCPHGPSVDMMVDVPSRCWRATKLWRQRNGWVPTYGNPTLLGGVVRYTPSSDSATPACGARLLMGAATGTGTMVLTIR